MKNLLEKLYKKVIYYGEEYMQSGKRLDEEVRKLLEPYRSKLSQSEIEELQNLIYTASYTAQYEGFRLGAKAVVNMLIDILSH
ncbi:MAG: hypothetical protein J6C64_13630 [Lachnospiraceae bacterium]|nr:hypothetical protein [Lachnospiraceae bacterium]